MLSIDVVHLEIFWAAILSLSLLMGALIVWTRGAPALADLAGLPAIAMVITIAMNARSWASQAVDTEVFDAPVPKMVSIIVVIAAALSLAAARRSLRGGQASAFMAALAALFAPAVAIAIEVCWQPADSLGTYFWALHAMTLAAIMVWMAERFARADGADDRLRMSFAVLSALSCVTFSMVIMFTEAALTTAIAVAIVAAAALDHRFKLPLMGSFILAGVSAIGYRLVADPGIDWAVQTSWPQMLFVTGGVVVAFLATWILVAEAHRRRLAILMESATVSATGIFLTLVLMRGAIDIFGPRETDIPWMPGVMAAVWLLLGFSQLRRIDMKGWLVWIRTALAVVFLLGGALCIVMSIAFTPLDGTTFRVEGTTLLNTLILAYLLPAIVLLIGSVWLTGQPRWSRMLFRAAGLALATFWAGHVIRHAWRGPDAMMLPGVGQGEMITYTIAILAVGAGLFTQSLARRSVSLRRWGLVVIGVAVAKVFLVDIGEMNGLVRVGALLLLGLSLAGLAWLNRWAAERTSGGRGPDDVQHLDFP